MFESYNCKKFGEKIKKLRNELGYSQADVSQATGINVDTLRKIENGYSLPRYDTLIYLSRFYNEDVSRIFHSCQRSKLLLEFYNSLDYLMLLGRFEEIRNLHTRFLHELSKNDDLQLVSNDTLEQIELFIHSLSLRYSSDSNEALNKIIEGLRVTKPDFNISSFTNFKYDSFEIRCLVVAAACLGDLRECLLSNKILHYVLGIVNCDIFSDKADDMIVIKALGNISYNHHRLNENEMALEFAQKGINISIMKGHLDILHFLFLREAVAKLLLKDETCIESFKKCLFSLKIQNNQAHYNLVEEMIKNKYGFSFESL